jgi:Niemann-Pick C1 protein
MFILVFEFRSTAGSGVVAIEDRCRQALERCGLSILYTTATDFVAFSLGSSTSLPAVRYFCVYGTCAGTPRHVVAAHSPLAP